MNLVKDLCNKEYEVVTIMIDNVSTINPTNDHIACGISKHVYMRFHYSIDLVSEGKLKLAYCKSGYQVIDFLTKRVSIEVFKSLKKHMNTEDLEDLN